MLKENRKVTCSHFIFLDQEYGAPLKLALPPNTIEKQIHRNTRVTVIMKVKIPRDLLSS